MTEAATIVYTSTCAMVIHPSIRSKLLQKLLKGTAPNASAIAITSTKSASAAMSHERRGRNSARTSARASHATAMTSTMMRKAKFLPVMYGKKSDGRKMRQTKGSAKTPAIQMARRVFSSVVMSGILARAPSFQRNPKTPDERLSRSPFFCIDEYGPAERLKCGLDTRRVSPRSRNPLPQMLFAGALPLAIEAVGLRYKAGKIAAAAYDDALCRPCMREHAPNLFIRENSGGYRKNAL